VSRGERFLEGLRPPPGLSAVPDFDRGWRTGANGGGQAFISYAGEQTVNWSDELEDIHEESSRDHFIDVWTRQALLDGIEGCVPSDGVVVDLGCSTGYLLEDLRKRYPATFLVGVDLVAAGLPKAHELVPDAALLQADACELPFGDASVDAVVSANLLEHIPDDEQALREIRRILKPVGRGALVVPAGPGLYDYYDEYLGHERRYHRGELARKARAAGLDVVLDAHLGSLLFPPFWVTKKVNRRGGRISEQEMRQRVTEDIDRTQHSALGSAACKIERRAMALGIRPPFGIRGYTVVQRKAT
jgi:SAM-dependent methyltransferase